LQRVLFTCRPSYRLSLRGEEVVRRYPLRRDSGERPACELPR
jgi:hypothetical protein